MGALENHAIAARCDEVRQTMGILALLHAGGELGDRDMANAVLIIERELTAIVAVASGRAIALPVMTLADVAARATARANPLSIIQGGLSS